MAHGQRYHHAYEPVATDPPLKGHLWTIRTGLPRVAVYVIDLTHYLNAKGSIALERGPARKMADFLTTVVAHASDFDRADDNRGPVCFRCRKRDDRRVETGMTEDETIVWRCRACGTEGQISNWRDTFWDLSRGTP